MTPQHTRHRRHDPAGWDIIIPVKDTGLAKSRLAPFTASDRAALALAFALDAATAAMDCAAVRRVVAVTNDRAAAVALGGIGVEVLPDLPAGGLNSAVSHGMASLREEDPVAAVAAMCGDLPALRAGDLTAAFALAGSAERWFVTDAAGVGTTMLAAGPGIVVQAAFGAGSRERHRSLGLVDLIASSPGTLSRLRRDVDTPADLADARRLGVGSYTGDALLGIDAA